MASARKHPPAPLSLGAEGKTLWRAILGVYELAPAEVETLRQACRVTDLLARMDAELLDSDLTAEGSMGQVKAHPLITASADQRRVLDALFRSLCLPMPDEATGRRRSPAAVASAQARWRAGRG